MIACLALCALLAPTLAAADVPRATGTGAAPDPRAAIEERIMSADSVRVARVREPKAGETGESGEDRLSDVIVEREARVDTAWKASMAEAITEAMRRFPVPEICSREAGARRIRFAVQFVGGGQRTTIILYLADRCFEFWSGRTFEGSAEMRDVAHRILALLKQAFPTDTTVRHLDLKGMISCEDYQREHPGDDLVEQPPGATRMVPPKYPKEAKKAKVEGRVLLQARIGVDGVVGEVKVLESVPGLDAAAIAAVRQWQFEPALDCWGSPVSAWIVIPVNFRLD